jgi:nucleoside-diphosphate-sugar epimerase
VILLDHSEQNLLELNLQLMAAGASNYAAVLEDIFDSALLTEIFEQYRPDTIYHAAAFKHVPLMESNPVAAVRNHAREFACNGIACSTHAGRAILQWPHRPADRRGLRRSGVNSCLPSLVKSERAPRKSGEPGAITREEIRKTS